MSLLEKEEEIHEKEEEILELKRCAEGRLQIIDQLRHSYYYRLGYALLGPLGALKRVFHQERVHWEAACARCNCGEALESR